MRPAGCLGQPETGGAPQDVVDRCCQTDTVTNGYEQRTDIRTRTHHGTDGLTFINQRYPLSFF